MKYCFIWGGNALKCAHAAHIHEGLCTSGAKIFPSVSWPSPWECCGWGGRAGWGGWDEWGGCEA